MHVHCPNHHRDFGTLCKWSIAYHAPMMRGRREHQNCMFRNLNSSSVIQTNSWPQRKIGCLLTAFTYHTRGQIATRERHHSNEKSQWIRLLVISAYLKDLRGHIHSQVDQISALHAHVAESAMKWTKWLQVNMSSNNISAIFIISILSFMYTLSKNVAQLGPTD